MTEDCWLLAAVGYWQVQFNHEPVPTSALLCFPDPSRGQPGVPPPSNNEQRSTIPHLSLPVDWEWSDRHG